MAPTPLLTLSTELFSIMAGLLPLNDLRNLRLACRTLEHETYANFVHRGYAQRTLSFQRHYVRDFARALKSPRLAGEIRRLTLRSLTEVGKTLWCRDQHNSWKLAGVSEAVDLWDLMAQMPNLSAVQLDDLDGSSFALLFPTRGPADAQPSYPSVTSLELRHIKLRSEDFRQLLQAFATNLQELKLSWIDSQGGDWPSICPTLDLNLTSLELQHISLDSAQFCTVIDAAGPALQRLELSYIVSLDGQWTKVFQTLQGTRLQRLVLLSLATSAAGEHLVWLGERQRVNKAIRGQEGIGHFWVQRKSAAMAGGNAVQAGVHFILGLIVGR
ncbi:hypothetical protein LTR85_010001 [Meristemomyces frigidus]|nr:hypothetical protein LTR85_010001 [Meristemomyces frigidus]